MAVVVQCFQCNAVLELDDGFRGGVCRCSGCGTLLQVPRGEVEKAKRTSRPATPGIKTSTQVSAPTPEESEVSRRLVQRTDRPEETSATAMDTGGSSSSLSPIQRTRPIAAQERADADKPSKDADSQEPEPTSTGSTYTPMQEPAMQEVTQNNKLLRTAWGLLILLAIVVVMSVVIYWSKGDQDNSGSTTLPDHPSNIPASGR